MKRLTVAALVLFGLSAAWVASVASARVGTWQPKTTACAALSTSQWAQSYLPGPVSAGFSEGQSIYCFWQGGDDANATLDLYYYSTPGAAAADFASQGGCSPHEQRPSVAGGKATFCFTGGASSFAELKGHLWLFFSAKNRSLAEAAQLRALLALAQTAFTRLGD